MEEPILTKEQGKVLINAFLKLHRLEARQFEDLSWCLIARISAPNGRTIGSVTLPPGVFEMPISAAQRLIGSMVLEACRACAGEPASRGL